VLNHSRFISCQKNSKFENLYRMSSWNETRPLKLQKRSHNSVLTIFIISSRMLKQVSEMAFFISQTFSTPGKKIIESCLTYLLRNLQYCDPNDFFKFGKLMWIFLTCVFFKTSHRELLHDLRSGEQAHHEGWLIKRLPELLRKSGPTLLPLWAVGLPS